MQALCLWEGLRRVTAHWVRRLARDLGICVGGRARARTNGLRSPEHALGEAASGTRSGVRRGHVPSSPHIVHRGILLEARRAVAILHCCDVL